MEVWIQRHDYSTDSLPESDQESSLAALERFDWESEFLGYEAALDAQADRCPPGMGFVDGDRLLHIMPIREGRSHYHYACDHPVRLFAIFGANKSLNAWAIPDRYRPELVGLHYDGRQADLVSRLAELTNPE